MLLKLRKFPKSYSLWFFGHFIRKSLVNSILFIHKELRTLNEVLLNMTFFFCKLIAPRSTFAQDMTEAERSLMGVHSGYLRTLADRGIAVVFGPVMDPKGAWGLCIMEVSDETQARTLLADDPVIKANAGFRYEISPMAQAVMRKDLS